MEKLSDEELNKWVHTVLLGECEHDFPPSMAVRGQTVSVTNVSCKKCGIRDYLFHGYPSYCTDLNLAAKAEAKIIKKGLWKEYYLQLWQQFASLNDTTNLTYIHVLAITATARQRCDAIYAMFKND